MAPRIAYYGDDFTGATDTLATATQGGLRTLLFLRVPTAEMLARAGDLDCVGIAGASRSMTPADMEGELRPVAEFLAGVGAPITHYKTCSTFDSAPAIGNIAVALRVLSERIPGRYIPIVGGQPNIGRYCVFGHLFAAAESGGPMLRIDRHPMSRHPVTPMTESDLRLHLERQGLRHVCLVPYPSYELVPDALPHPVEGASALLFDVSRAADLAPIGGIIWREASRARLVAAGPSGVTQALCAHWHESGEVRPVPNVPPIAAADGPMFVIAGSLSSVTRRQIESATIFMRVPIDPALLTRGDENYLAKLVAQVSELMHSGHSVIAHTSPLGENFRDETLPGIEIAKATGEFMARLLSATQPRRIGIAGGDTSSWTLRALDVWGLSFIGHLAPGVALCRAHSGDRNLDGIEIMLKGGQMGPHDLFLRLRGGG
jgi:3-oxoisoapionate kinase